MKIRNVHVQVILIFPLKRSEWALSSTVFRWIFVTSVIWAQHALWDRFHTLKIKIQIPSSTSAQCWEPKFLNSCWQQEKSAPSLMSTNIFTVGYFMRDKTNIWRPLEVHGRVRVLSEAIASTCTFGAKFQLHWVPQEFNWLRVTHSPKGHCSSLGFSHPQATSWTLLSCQLSTLSS